jgi:hypothetical protein
MEAFKGDGHNPQVPNLLKGVLIGRDVYRFEGARALFKGLGPTLSGVVPARYPPVATFYLTIEGDQYIYLLQHQTSPRT